MDNVVKPDWKSTEFWAALVAIVTGGLVGVFGVPESMAGELQGQVNEAVVQAAGILASLGGVWAFLDAKYKIKEGGFLEEFTNTPGWQTGELWVYVVGSVVVPLLVIFGALSPEQGEELGSNAAALITALLAMGAGAIRYAKVRGVAKATTVSAIEPA